MGFEPQTADQPLVNPHKRTTKVNLAMAIAVVVFLIIGICGVFWASRQPGKTAPSDPPVGVRK